MALNAGITAADIVQSNGTRITRDSTSQVTGITTAGATITVDRDGDGMFNDGSATAGIDGSFAVDVTLLHTAPNHGENRLVVKSVLGANSADTAVNAHLAVGTVVHFATNQGAYDVELLDTEAPLTVANFLSYVDSGAYQNMFVHRTNSGSAKFIQGGGFKVVNGEVSSVVTTAPVANEFMAANSNVSGTLSMALLGDDGGGSQPNSGTSQWFVNTSNNGAGFDPGNYTVFGRVIGDGLTVASRISDLTQRNLNTLYASTALGEVPLSDFNPANTQITGTVAITSNSAVLTGTGTLFTTELAVGKSIVIGNGRAYFVASIQSDTSLTLTTTAPFTAANLAVTKDVVPNDADFVIFSNIGKILDTI
ncbi:MAG: peptidylprolyl isomerase [Planctomycetaceae bacterium]